MSRKRTVAKENKIKIAAQKKIRGDQTIHQHAKTAMQPLADVVCNYWRLKRKKNSAQMKLIKKF
jgi:hypothetical protein